MSDKDLEKALTQIEDALPKIMERVQKFVDMAEDMDNAFSVSASYKKVSEQELKGFFLDLQEQEKLLADISNFMLQMDKFYMKAKLSKRAQSVRKDYQAQQTDLMNSVAKIRTVISKLATDKSPPQLKESAKELFGCVRPCLASKKVSQEQGTGISYSQGKIVFAVWFKIEGAIKSGKKDTAAKTTGYIVLTQKYNKGSDVLDPVLVNVYRDTMPDLPKEAKSWTYSDPLVSQRRIINLFAAHNMGRFIVLTPETKNKSAFKITKQGAAKMQRLMQNKRYKGILKYVQKGPVLTALIHEEGMEGYSGDKLSGKIMVKKLEDRLVDLEKLFPSKRNLQYQYDTPQKSKVAGPDGDDIGVYRLEVTFYEPGVLKFK
jgi:hypothetical protein